MSQIIPTCTALGYFEAYIQHGMYHKGNIISTFQPQVNTRHLSYIQIKKAQTNVNHAMCQAIKETNASLNEVTMYSNVQLTDVD